MTSKFDATERRRILLDPVVGIPRSLGQKLEVFAQSGGLWGGANNCVNQAVLCYVLGLPDYPAQLLAKASEWIRVAIDTRQPTGGFSEDFLLAEYHVTAALAAWLKDGRQEKEHLAKAVEFSLRHLAANPAEAADPTALNNYGPRFVDAGADEAWLGVLARSGRVAVPEKPEQAKTPAAVAGVLAQARRSGGGDAARLERTIAALLAKNLAEWFTRAGRPHYGAHWLKLRFAGDTRPPAEIIRESHRWLPGMTPT